MLYFKIRMIDKIILKESEYFHLFNLYCKIRIVIKTANYELNKINIIT